MCVRAQLLGLRTRSACHDDNNIDDTPHYQLPSVVVSHATQCFFSLVASFVLDFSTALNTHPKQTVKVHIYTVCGIGSERQA